jgi:cationic amino acid transporter 1
MGALFPLPRVIYAMAKDGIIFRFLATVHPRFQTPVIGTFVAGICTGIQR